MPIQTITVGGNSVQLVTLPTTPGFRTVKLTASTPAALVSSPFTGQTQVQRWPGADMWKGVISLPPLTSAQHDVWVAALLQLQGMTNAFQFGDPLKRSPRGVVRGTPAVNTAIAMPTGSSTLYTLGWTPNSTNLLLAGDYIQLGLRLHRVLDSVNSDVDGKASVPIWPSLREAPSGNITYNSPKGLFRLATSEQDWDYDFTKLTNLSISIQEYR